MLGRRAGNSGGLAASAHGAALVWHANQQPCDPMHSSHPRICSPCLQSHLLVPVLMTRCWAASQVLQVVAVVASHSTQPDTALAPLLQSPRVVRLVNAPATLTTSPLTAVTAMVYLVAAERLRTTHRAASAGRHSWVGQSLARVVPLQTESTNLSKSVAADPAGSLTATVVDVEVVSAALTAASTPL